MNSKTSTTNANLDRDNYKACGCIGLMVIAPTVAFLLYMLFTYTP
ncbi:hypothetical protein N9B31_08630 [Mariniblastus sp.]|nr:hypothetical protein [bacterium]MDA7903714.1 hypothetical protein [Mariniblastus sp.]